MPVKLPAVTLCVTTSDSWSPKLRYARRYMRRSPSESSFCAVFFCAMQLLPPQARVKAGTPETVFGPLKVVFAGVAQLTWNLYICTLGDEPAGAKRPSR